MKEVKSSVDSLTMIILFIFISVVLCTFLAKQIDGEAIAPICADNNGVASVTTATYLGITYDATVVCKDGSVESL
jgi:hypothetical protein